MQCPKSNLPTERQAAPKNQIAAEYKTKIVGYQEITSVARRKLELVMMKK